VKTFSPIPVDGPAGLILTAAGRHNMRPAHVHFIVSAEGYETVISELFTVDDPYVEGDAVFGVKESLKIKYVRGSIGSRLKFEGSA
jgi:hydroxyquinol 1,2-dioxygenase